MLINSLILWTHYAQEVSNILAELLKYLEPSIFQDGSK